MADRKNINPRRPIPASGYDRLRTNMKSNFRDGFPTIKDSFPGPDNRPVIGKGNENKSRGLLYNSLNSSEISSDLIPPRIVQSIADIPILFFQRMRISP